MGFNEVKALLGECLSLCNDEVLLILGVRSGSIVSI